MNCPKCHSPNPDEAHFCRNCGTQLQVSEKADISTVTLQPSIKELSRGTIFAGRYEVIEEVALKLLRSEIASDRETIKRFSNELRMARHISYKYVCRL